jgi:hypothetical protein
MTSKSNGKFEPDTVNFDFESNAKEDKLGN